MKSYLKLKNIFNDFYQLQFLQRILGWEEMIFMPEGSGIERAKALATLKSFSHKSLASNQLKSLLAKANTETLNHHWDKVNLQWFQKIYTSSKVIPDKLQAKSTKAILLALQGWRKHRDENNWKDFQPLLNQSFLLIKEIAKRKSDKLGQSPYDVLLDQFSTGLKSSTVDKLFSKLKPQIIGLREKILLKQKFNCSPNVKTPLSIELQKKLAQDFMTSLKFDFNHGRLDVSNHPYCDGIGTDIRITTRYDENNLFESLYSVLHETGHAIYEQGTPKEWLFQPVGQAHCKVTHESIALLFENEIGRSRPFMEQLEKKISLLSDGKILFKSEDMLNKNTKIKNTLLRLDADEISYVLHIFMRYEIEQLLFNDEIKVKDLPEIWNEKMMNYFNISSKNDFKNGVMQDMHWAFGYFGYFPIYVCGQVMASQLFSSCIRHNSNILNEIASLNFENLYSWLNKNVFSLAASCTSQEILKRATNMELNESDFFNQLKYRYQI